MPEFTVTRQIEAPVERVWEVLENFGDIYVWNSGVKRSSQTSPGDVGEGTTRHCDFTPFGGVDERIDRFTPNERMTIALFNTSKLPIAGGVADFVLAEREGGTELSIKYSYTLNKMGKLAKSTTAKQMQKGIGGLADDLATESERIAA